MVSGFPGRKVQRRQRVAGQTQTPMPRPRRSLTLSNRQSARHVDLRLLRRIVQALFEATCPVVPLDLGVYIVAAPEMTRLNETFLGHQGPTDVITFDYGEGRPRRGLGGRDACPTLLHGEVFVCLDEAMSQARRFHATWQSELVRYVVHGLLHLLGHDDRDARARRKMKAAEAALVRHLARQFDFRGLSPAG
jgi:probable rRNA maturation factor